MKFSHKCTRWSSALLGMVVAFELLAVPVMAAGQNSGINYDIKGIWYDDYQESVIVRLTSAAQDPEGDRIMVAAYDSAGRQTDLAIYPISNMEWSARSVKDIYVPIKKIGEEGSYKAFVLSDQMLPVANAQRSKQMIYSTKTPKGDYSAYVFPQEIRDMIQYELVPNASAEIAKVFPETFSYLSEAMIGIGYQEQINKKSNAIAYVNIENNVNLENGGDVKLGYTLMVNQYHVDEDQDGLYSPEEIRQLKNTLAHEIMHAMMYEALTAGMTSYSANGEKVPVTDPRGDAFPRWFMEGMAVTAGGGSQFIQTFSLENKSSSNPTDLKTVENYMSDRDDSALGADTDTSNYATGYLACMFLGSIIGGMSAAEIADGLDTLLYTVSQGYSLDTAIQKLTEKTPHPFTGIDDFEQRFAHEGAAFSIDLAKSMENGIGSLLTKDMTAIDAISDGINSGLTPFELDISAIWVVNQYHHVPVVYKGGRKRTTGYDLKGNYPRDAVQPPIKLPDGIITQVNG